MNNLLGLPPFGFLLFTKINFRVFYQIIVLLCVFWQSGFNVVFWVIPFGYLCCLFNLKA